MNLPPSGDPRWPALSAPVLAFLRALPGGATWPALAAWMRSARWTITRATNALAWLEGEGLARSSGGREVRPGLARVTKNKGRRREARVGEHEEVRWWAVREAPAVPRPLPAGAPCPVVRGQAPPAVLPPLRGPFLSPRPASPPSPSRAADPDPGIRVSRDGPLRLPSADRTLREEACAPQISSVRGRPVRNIAALAGTGEPTTLPGRQTIEERARRHREDARKHDAVKRARRQACAKSPARLKAPLPHSRIVAREAAKAETERKRAAFLASGPRCKQCGRAITEVRATGPLPKRCAACIAGSTAKPRREAHPATCGCAECD